MQDPFESTSFEPINLRARDGHLPPQQIAARQILEKDYVDLFRHGDISKLTNDQLIDLNDEIRRTKAFYNDAQSVCKLNANSLYGALGASFFRWHRTCVAADITAEGRNAIKMLDALTNLYFSKKWPTELEFFASLKAKYREISIDAPQAIICSPEDPIAIYSDTDSLFLDMRKFVESLKLVNASSQTICNILNEVVSGPLMKLYETALAKYITSRNGQNHYVFELEAILRRMILLAKKKYFGSYLVKDGVYIAKDKKLKSTGIELATNGTPELIKKIIKLVIYRILSSTKFDKEYIYELAVSARKEFEHKHIDSWSKVRKLSTYSKYIEIDKYGRYHALKGASNVIKGCCVYNNYVIDHGLTNTYKIIDKPMRVKFYVSTDPRMSDFTYPIEDDCQFPSFAPPPNIDENLKKLLFDPLVRILEPVYGHMVDLGKEYRAKSLAYLLDDDNGEHRADLELDLTENIDLEMNFDAEDVEAAMHSLADFER